MAPGGVRGCRRRRPAAGAATVPLQRWRCRPLGPMSLKTGGHGLERERSPHLLQLPGRRAHHHTTAAAAHAASRCPPWTAAAVLPTRKSGAAALAGTWRCMLDGLLLLAPQQPPPVSPGPSRCTQGRGRVLGLAALACQATDAAAEAVAAGGRALGVSQGRRVCREVAGCARPQKWRPGLQDEEHGAGGYAATCTTPAHHGQPAPGQQVPVQCGKRRHGRCSARARLTAEQVGLVRRLGRKQQRPAIAAGQGKHHRSTGVQAAAASLQWMHSTDGARSSACMHSRNHRP